MWLEYTILTVIPHIASATDVAACMISVGKSATAAVFVIVGYLQAVKSGT